MELSVEQQIFETLEKSSKVLIALPEVLNADTLASGLALKLFLQKLGKEVELASSGKADENLKFLPGSDTLKFNLTNGKSLVVVVNTANKKLDEVSYEVGQDKVNIYLKPKSEPFTQEDVSFTLDKFRIDAVFVLGCKSQEDLGKLFEQQPDLFFETPKINIDNKAGNE